MTTHEYCREYLRLVMKDVRKHFTPEQIKKAWAWSGDGRHFEFHGPTAEFIHDIRSADCLWSAKAGGWEILVDWAEKLEKLKKEQLKKGQS